jgi:hypothetical protein
MHSLMACHLESTQLEKTEPISIRDLYLISGESNLA